MLFFFFEFLLSIECAQSTLYLHLYSTGSDLHSVFCLFNGEKSFIRIVFFLRCCLLCSHFYHINSRFPFVPLRTVYETCEILCMDIKHIENEMNCSHVYVWSTTRTFLLWINQNCFLFFSFLEIINDSRKKIKFNLTIQLKNSRKLP